MGEQKKLFNILPPFEISIFNGRDAKYSTLEKKITNLEVFQAEIIFPNKLVDEEGNFANFFPNPLYNI